MQIAEIRMATDSLEDKDYFAWWHKNYQNKYSNLFKVMQDPVNKDFRIEVENRISRIRSEYSVEELRNYAKEKA